MAILAAYVQRLRTGEGQQIELSMQEAVTYFMRTRIAFGGNWGEQAVPRIGNIMGAAPTGLYPCAGDGPNDYAYLIAVTDRHWDALCLAIERPELAVDPRFETGEKRAIHGAELFEEVTAWTRQHEKHEVMRRLGDAGVPCSAILDTRDLYNDPHLLERGFVRTVEHPELGEARLLGFPPRMSASHVDVKRAPYLGEHSDAVLRADLDLDEAELEALHDEGTLG
jgi:formyl-CoA transferase